MKKIIFITTLLLVCFSVSAFAAVVNLNGLAGTTITLSQNVQGTYSADGTGTAARNFMMSTGHTQGNTAYATSNFDSAIYKSPYADPNSFVSSDLLNSTTFTSATISGFGTAM